MLHRYSTSHSNVHRLQTLCSSVRMRDTRSSSSSLEPLFSSFSIRGLVKTKALHEQIKSMEQLILPIKGNKDQVKKQIEDLRQTIDRLIGAIMVEIVLEGEANISHRSSFDLEQHDRWK